MEKGGGELVDASSFVDLCTLHQHAMRYYRLWIYASNFVLLIASLIFTLVAISILVDPRISLLSGVELYQPTFLYAYVALFIQCGVLQAIGCVGALRLHQKLLTTYWTLLLVLMIGDVLVGLVWAFRLDRIKSNLRPQLKQRLISQYGNDSQFTQTWNWVQTNDMCCGVDGPLDFLRFNDSSSNNHFDSNGLPSDVGLHPKLPPSCCTFTITYDFPFTTTPHPNNIPSSSLKGSDSNSNFNSTSGNQQRHSRINYPHYPNHNYTMHLSSFSSSGTTHNRRRIQLGKTKHEMNRHPEPSQNHRPNVQTTTESSRRPTHHYGVCWLPPDLLAKYKNNIYIKISDTIIDNYSFEGSGSGGSSISSSSSEESNNNIVEIPPEQLNNSPLSFSTTFSSVLDSTTTSFSSSGRSKSMLWSTTTTTSIPPTESPNHSSSSTETPSPSHILIEMTLNEEGCGEKVLEWLDHASDVLFVIGFCIIVFVKGCFVAILRYEIKEMIQKIKLLNGEDDGRQAAMNELIGLTSMYAGVRDEDNAEREGLMASGSAQPSDTITTNIDAIESDTRRKDSVISHHNCHMGNNVGHIRKMSYVAATNPVSMCSSSSAGGSGCNNTTTTTTTGNPRYSIIGTSAGGSSHNKNENDIEEDFDSGSALLGRPPFDPKLGQSQVKSYKNENGGRSLPRNGNNNTSGLTGSASAPIPIDSMAKA